MSETQITTEQDAFRYCEDTKILKNRIEKGGLELGKRLCLIKNNNLAEAQYGGFDLFLDEIRIKPSTATHLMKVYQRLVIDYGVSEQLIIDAGGYTRVYELFPIIKDKETAVEALTHASTLQSRESIKQYVKEAMTGNFETVDCQHPNTFTLKICKDCGNKEKQVDADTGI